MDIDAKRLSDAISDLYAATTDPQARTALAHNLAKAFDATSCLFHTRESGPGGVSILGATENFTTFLPSYAAHYYKDDRWSELALRRVGQAMIGEELVPERELLRSEWYLDLCRPHLIHHLVGAVFEIEPEVKGLIGFHRPSGASGFESRDVAMMDLLIPHLKQAVRLLRVLDHNQRARRLTFDVLAALAVGVFVVGCDSRAHFINAAAERIAAAGSPVVLRNGRVSLLDAKLDDRLHRAVAQACLAGIGRSVSAGAEILVRRRDGDDILLLVIPLPPDTKPTGPTEPLAAVLAGEHPASPEIPAQVVQTIYGLTQAEARVLLALLKGQSLPEIAKGSGVSINTVRTQTKSVFAKTGARRQSDLVARVLLNPIWRLNSGLRSHG